MQNIVLLYGSFAKETYDFKEPTACSHPISAMLKILVAEVVKKFWVAHVEIVGCLGGQENSGK